MCEFVSWIEIGVEGNKKAYFLTAEQIFNTPQGKKLREHCRAEEDYKGHGAIRHYYKLGEREGINKECTDFSTPDNFPEEIVTALKAGEFRGMARPQRLLTKKAMAEYDKVAEQAWAEYDKMGEQAWAEYNKAVEQAFWDLFMKPENRVKSWR